MRGALARSRVAQVASAHAHARWPRPRSCARSKRVKWCNATTDHAQRISTRVTLRSARSQPWFSRVVTHGCLAEGLRIASPMPRRAKRCAPVCLNACTARSSQQTQSCLLRRTRTQDVQRSVNAGSPLTRMPRPRNAMFRAKASASCRCCQRLHLHQRRHS